MTSGTNTHNFPIANEQHRDSFFNNQFEIDCDDDFIIISVRMYKFFMAHGKDGLEAKQLYDHLIFASRVQGTKNLRANVQYIKNGLGWGNQKVKKAKAFLSAAGLIQYDQPKSESGKFQGQRIILKSTWNTESLKTWIENKSQRNQDQDERDPEESKPPIEDKTPAGSEIEPAEDMVSPDTEDTKCPVVHSTGQRLTDPAVPSDNYKGSYKKEILPQEETPPPEAATPLRAGISSLEELKTHLISLVKKRDPSSMFYFTTQEVDLLKTCFDRYGPDWIIDRFKTYLKSKTVSQFNRFHADDFPRVMKRAMSKSTAQKPKAKPLQPKDHKCPVCGKTWTASSTLSMCPKCALDLKDFNNAEEVESHREWYENDLKPRLEGTT